MFWKFRRDALASALFVHLETFSWQDKRKYEDVISPAKSYVVYCHRTKRFPRLRTLGTEIHLTENYPLSHTFVFLIGSLSSPSYFFLTFHCVSLPSAVGISRSANVSGQEPDFAYVSDRLSVDTIDLISDP